MLMELFASTEGTKWLTYTAWASATKLEDWHGVETNDTEEIIRLSLHENNLAGGLLRF